jgi:DNA invertase Pin-like site-specific DNA recombinase
VSGTTEDRTGLEEALSGVRFNGASGLVVTSLDRLARGRRHKADEGGYAYGAPPFGFRSESGELVPDPVEQAVIEQMVDLRARGWSLRQIAEALNEGRFPSKRAGRWHPQTVSRVLAQKSSR